MTDELQPFFDAGSDAVPPVDPGFRLALMERVARRRFYISLALEAGAALLAGLVLMAAWPALNAFALQFGALSAQLTGPVSTIAVTLVALAVLTYAARWVSTIRMRR